jgi:hypothetical protein
MIEYVLHFAKHGNVVIGPAGVAATRKVTLLPEGRTFAEIIESLCKQADLQCTLHGDVLFIRKKEKAELPNKALDATSP